MALLAALAATAALVLVWPLPALLPGGLTQAATRPATRPAVGRASSAWSLGLVTGAFGLLVLGLPRSWLVPGAIALAATYGAVLLVARRRARRAAWQTGRRVLDTCEHLAAELGAGQPPGAALQGASQDWPPLLPVAEAFRIGSDVPSALRAVARRPGAGDLRLVAAAWQVSERTGQGLADAVSRVSRGLGDAAATRRIVAGELASARATARLVAALPLAALAMGSGVGGDPLAFLLATPVGWLCLGSGLAFALVGLWWIEALARHVDRG